MVAKKYLSRYSSQKKKRRKENKEAKVNAWQRNEEIRLKYSETY